MPHNICANHNTYSLGPILKRLSEDNDHNIGHLEAYFIFVNALQDWSLMKYCIADFCVEFVFVRLENYNKNLKVPGLPQVRVQGYLQVFSERQFLHVHCIVCN